MLRDQFQNPNKSLVKLYEIDSTHAANTQKTYISYAF